MPGIALPFSSITLPTMSVVCRPLLYGTWLSVLSTKSLDDVGVAVGESDFTAMAVCVAACAELSGVNVGVGVLASVGTGGGVFVGTVMGCCWICVGGKGRCVGCGGGWTGGCVGWTGG